MIFLAMLIGCAGSGLSLAIAYYGWTDSLLLALLPNAAGWIIGLVLAWATTPT